MDAGPRALLLKFPGTNCDRETARALETVGFEAAVRPVADLEPADLTEPRVVVLSGGFSYGDYVRAGRFARLVLQRKLDGALGSFVEDGGYVLGICNGFQILLELGLLPEGSLIQNTSRRFVCRWVSLSVEAPNEHYLDGLPDRFELPVAHMEGRFVAAAGRAESYREAGRVPLVYGENPNGSQADIAALHDETGRVFGLMPHPERYLYREDHYAGRRSGEDSRGWGYYFFRSLYGAVTGDRSATPVRTGV